MSPGYGRRLMRLACALVLASLVFSVGGLSTCREAWAASKTTRGRSFDRYIGLDESVLVLAKARRKVRVRSRRSNESALLGTFLANNCVVVDTSGMKKGRRYQWLKVKLGGTSHGYVASKSVSIVTLDTKTFGLDRRRSRNRKRIRICRKGLPYLGVNYRARGTDLSTGVACNTFALISYNSVGMNIPWSANSPKGLARYGRSIRREDLKPGDLVVYGTPAHPRTPMHVAIYVGNDLIINSSGYQGTTYPTGGIRISQLDYRTPRPYLFKSIESLL